MNEKRRYCGFCLQDTGVHVPVSPVINCSSCGVPWNRTPNSLEQAQAFKAAWEGWQGPASSDPSQRNVERADAAWAAVDAVASA